MLFRNIHKWSVTDVKYERGAWVRVYGVPDHAWNDDFFKLCVMNSGRFIRADECTVDKARLDFARILVSTTQLDIVNTTSEFSIDGCAYVIKLMEEWGCNLGEDAFLTEIENESLPDTLPQLNIDDGMEEVQGESELDDLVDDFHKEWSKHELKNEGKHPVREEAVTHVSKVLKKENGIKQQAHFNTVLEPVLCPVDIKVASDHQGSKTQSTLCPSRPSNKGPWSLDFLTQAPIQEGDIVFTAKQVDVVAQPPKLKGNRESLLVEQHSSKKRSVGKSKHSVVFLKRVARMPSADRKEILKILKKQNHKRKTSKVTQTSKPATISNSDSSKNSSSYVNKDWENWVVLHYKSGGVSKDVEELGKVIGVNFKGDSNISFNLLSRAGRKEWRAVVGGDVTGERVGDVMGDSEGF